MIKWHQVFSPPKVVTKKEFNPSSGQVYDILYGGNRQLILIGDVNSAGGVCDDCPFLQDGESFELIRFGEVDISEGDQIRNEFVIGRLSAPGFEDCEVFLQRDGQVRLGWRYLYFESRYDSYEKFFHSFLEYQKRSKVFFSGSYPSEELIQEHFGLPKELKNG